MAVGSQPENFGIVDARWTGQSVELTIRHFNVHGHPYALLGPSETRRLIDMLSRAVEGHQDATAYKPPQEPSKEAEPEIDAADFEF